MQGAQIQSLVRELDPTGRNRRSCIPQLRLLCTARGASDGGGGMGDAALAGRPKRRGCLELEFDGETGENWRSDGQGKVEVKARI